MWSQIILLLLVVTTSTSFNIGNIIEGIKDLEKCKPTTAMVDASGKIPSGILSGNVLEIGAFDQCLNIEHGKYCLVKINIPLELLNNMNKNDLFIDAPIEDMEKAILVTGVNTTGIAIGWCVPDGCPIYQLTGAITNATQLVVKDFELEPVMGGICQTKEDLEVEFDANDIAIIAFLSTTVFIMLISTIYDMYCYYGKKQPAHIIFVAFSVLTNGRKLLTVSKSSDQLGCLNGIRVISMMWVIIAHKYTMVAQQPNINALTIVDWELDPTNMYILNATVCVDTFLVLSGLLLAYIFCLQMEKGIQFNIPLFYLHRYLRLTPVLAMVVWLQATIVTKFGSGPFWHFTENFKKRCVDYWWPTLLYIQNYYNPTKICIDQSWYLPVDMHLYILSPLLLLPLWKWPKYTMYSLIVLVLSSMAIPFTITYIKDLPAGRLSGGEHNGKTYAQDYYFPTHTRFGPWLMGLMLGYYLFTLRKTRHNRISLHPAEITFGWLVGLALLVSTVYAPYNMVKESTVLENAFMNGFYRHGWSLGVCWVIYACTQGYGGPINAFLSWSVFHVLCRFSYTLYLTHFIVLIVRTSSLRTSTYFTDLHTMFSFWGDFVATLILSVILTLAYESPMMTIEKVLFGKGKRNKKTDKLKSGHTNTGFEQA